MNSNITFLKAVKSFEKYLLVEKGYSKLTIKEYKSDLRLFYNYLRNEFDYNKKFNIEKIEKFEIAEFLADIILERDNSPATRNRKLYALRSFFKYLVNYEYLEKNPAESIESSKTEIRAEPIYLKLNDAQRYIKAIKEKDGINVVRDTAIAKLFLYAGLRVSELVNLNLADINYNDLSIKFYGKGNKERYVPLHADVIETIKDYLPERNQIKVKDKDGQNALFLSRHGHRISVRSVQIFVKKYAKLAGVKNASKITPHKLRHTFASILYKETKDLKVLQDLLGHANVSTTQIYTHTDTEQKKQAIDDFPDL